MRPLSKKIRVRILEKSRKPYAIRFNVLMCVCSPAYLLVLKVICTRILITDNIWLVFYLLYSVVSSPEYAPD